MRRDRIWEPVVCFALAGMGTVGLVSPQGLASASFFPVVREAIEPRLLAALLLWLGVARFVIAVWLPERRTLRVVGAVLGAMVWGQWVMGFVHLGPTAGWRPGLAQVAALVLGELLFIYYTLRHDTLMRNGNGS